MAGFRVLDFLDAQGIEYKETGDNVYVHCVWCGSQDEGKHLGIRKDGTAYGCWRSSSHVGKSPAWLIQALTGWTPDQVKDYLKHGGAPAGTVADLKARVRALGERKKQKAPAPPDEEFPTAFRLLSPRGLRARFWTYLERRGFAREDVKRVARLYGLRCALSGEFRMRLVLPFTHGGKLVGWTARSILPGAEIRYLTFPTGPGSKSHVFNFDGANEGGQILVLVEGPMDALKLDFYGKPYGVRAVSCLGVTLTDAQRSEVYALAKGFRRVVVLLDDDAQRKAMDLSISLPGIRPPRARLPKGVADPGDLSPIQAARLAKQLVQTYAA